MREFRSPKTNLFLPIDLPKGPLDLEIGAGVGFHAVKFAKNNANRTLIAVEKTRNKFLKLQRRIQNHGMENQVQCVHANIMDWLPQSLPDGCIETCYILYPNPYPKKKQANLRFFNMPFFSVVIKKLVPRGTIYLATNMEFYFKESLGRCDPWGLEVLQSEPYRGEARTHFEKKYLERGEVCYQLIAQKRGHE